MQGSDRGWGSLLRPQSLGVQLYQPSNQGVGGRFHGAGNVHLGWVGFKGLPGALPSYEGRDPICDGKSGPGGWQTNNGGLEGHIPPSSRGGDQRQRGGMGGPGFTTLHHRHEDPAWAGKH